MKGNKRKQNGITLIALIITVIVMLILVGVTINVALNGELFTQAQTAAISTQKEAEREQLLSAMVVAIGTDAKVNLEELGENLPEDWEKGDDEGTFISPNGNVYTVDRDGNIKDANKTEGTTPGTGEENGGTTPGTGEENGGITPGTGEETENNSDNSYTFTIAEIMQKGMDATDRTRVIPIEEFWPADKSEELKNNAFEKIDVDGMEIFVATNIACSDNKFSLPCNGNASAFEDIYDGRWRLENLYVCIH